MSLPPLSLASLSRLSLSPLSLSRSLPTLHGATGASEYGRAAWYPASTLHVWFAVVSLVFGLWFGIWGLGGHLATNQGVPKTPYDMIRLRAGGPVERKFFIDNLLVRIHVIIVMIGWTGLALWEFEFPFPGSLTSTFLRGSYTMRPRVVGIMPGRSLQISGFNVRTL